MHVNEPSHFEPSTIELGGGHAGTGGSEQMVEPQTKLPCWQRQPSGWSFTQGGWTAAGQKSPWELHAPPWLAPAHGFGHEGAPSSGHFQAPPVQEHVSAWGPMQSVRCCVHWLPEEQAEVMFWGQSVVSPSTRPPQWSERRATRPRPARDAVRQRMRASSASAMPLGTS